MTLDQLRQDRRLTWQQVSYQLSEITRGEHKADYLHPHRLWKLRKGMTSPYEVERKALDKWSGGVVDSYKDEG